MSVSRREALFAGAALPVSAVLWKTSYGQAPAAQPAGAQPIAATKQPTGRDPLVGVCMLIAGRRQIEACRWAMDKLTNQDCKAFAKAEIDEHEHVKDELKQFGLQYPSIPKEIEAGTASAIPATGTTTPSSGVQQASAIQPIPAIPVGNVVFPPPASDFVAVDHEICSQCIANYKTAMQKKHGLKFDKAFIGDQLHEHHALRDKVEVGQRNASAEMMPVLNEAHKIIEQHISTLEQLMTRLDEMKDGEEHKK